MSRHGVEDCHHVADLGCERCHVGEEELEDFGVSRSACSNCHPREGVQGRRLILGATGSSIPHAVHGSKHPSLLRKEGLESPHR